MYLGNFAISFETNYWLVSDAQAGKVTVKSELWGKGGFKKKKTLKNQQKNLNQPTNQKTILDIGCCRSDQMFSFIDQAC